MQTLLIAEDKESMALMLKETLEASGYRAILAKDGAAAIKHIREDKLNLILTDMKLPKKDGMEVLSFSKEETPLTPVIVMTAYGSVETAVEAMKKGAFDFITKPFDTDHLLMLIKRALENQRLITENILLREEFSSRFGLPTIIGKSKSITDAAHKIQKVAQAKTTVLLLGESGTGKELFARAIHYLSPRKDYPFVPINCAAIPKGLLESELFGYEKGSFTGADSRKLGKLELAEKGTVFLDEIGELDMDLQAKLLRTLQDGEIERIGHPKPLKVDIRIVAASNKDLDRAVSENAFREDLYYRLSVFPIRIPPLRERKEDIPFFVDYFIKKYSADLKRAIASISAEAVEILMKYDWKGNVRELENTIERAIILCEGSSIMPEHISLNPLRGDAVLPSIPMEGTLEDAAKAALRIAETGRIKKAMKDSKGNKSRASESLGVSYKTLLTKIKEYGIE
jgi:DNA-binding NtrC family response regulator